MKKAKDCICIKCGEIAEVFWPIIDIDIRPNPYCKKCVMIEQIKVIDSLQNYEIEEEKLDKK